MLERRPGRGVGRFERVTFSPQVDNILINGDFQVWQRGAGPFTSATAVVNNDDAYFADMWVFLANGSDTCDISQETTAANLPDEGVAAIKLDVETGSRKFGILQIVEAANCRHIIGKRVSLSFKAKVTGTSISNLRAAVLSWSSTSDTVTSDVVSAWEASGVDPTLVANWTYENSSPNIPITTSYQTFQIEAISIDTASTTNVAVFIWVDDTDATVGDFLYITDVRLEPGDIANTDFAHQRFPIVQAACQRYYIQYDSGGSILQKSIAAGFCDTSTQFEGVFGLPVTMRVTPTVTAGAAASDFSVNSSAATEEVCTTIAFVGSSEKCINVQADVASGLTGGRGATWGTTTANAVLRISAEL